MRIFLLSVYFYLANFFFSLPSKFPFSFQIFEFLALWLLVFLLSSHRFGKIFLTIWLLLYTIAFSYVTFSGSLIMPHDICLFWSHIAETFESFFGLFWLFLYPFVFMLIGFVLIFYLKQTQARYPHLIILICIYFFIPFTHYDASFQLIKSLLQANCENIQMPLDSKSTYKPQFAKQSNQIIVVIGESMRYDKLALFGYTKDTTPNLDKLRSKLLYKTIYSGATNTDVALPLFFNGTQELSQINLSNNLFTLAKHSGYKTHFISAQTDKYLQYITPYLGNDIEHLHILNTKNDTDLVSYLLQIDPNSSNFIVLQMMGSHAPYTFYDKQYKKFQSDYDNCIYKSDAVLGAIFDFALTRDITTVFFSDHGEMLGEEDGFYGHNRFHPSVYQVPYISTNIQYFDKIQSQNDIYAILKYYMGYDKHPMFSPNIKINGSMINGEDGFREFKR